MIDRLEKFREQVAAEDAAPRGKMGEAALTKLRAMAGQNKIDALDTERFKNGLLSIAPTDAILGKLIERCSKDGKHAGRRAGKLRYWIMAGYLLGREIDSVPLVNFFSELSPDEAKMTDNQFATQWTNESAKKRLKSRLDRGIIKPELVETESKPREWWNPERCRKQGLCKAGKFCVFSTGKGKPKTRADGKQFCGKVCQEAYPIRLGNQKARELVSLAV